MRSIKIVLSVFLLWKDWWLLFRKAKENGLDSIYDYACRIKLRLGQSYIGHYAEFSGKPFFPHGVVGVFISGGVELEKIVLFFSKLRLDPIL